MTIQAPAHILAGLGLSNGHGLDFAMTGLAGNTRFDMGLMVEVNKLRLNGDRDPGNGFITGNVIGQDG